MPSGSGKSFKKQKPRIVAGICVLNEESWITHCVDSIRPAVDEVYLVEGAVQGQGYCTPNGHSLDNTINLLRSRYREDPNVHLIQNPGKWPDKETQQNQFVKNLKDGDWLLHIGADEIIHPDTLWRIRKQLEWDVEAREFVLRHIHFWHDYKHRIKPMEKGSGSFMDRHQRMTKFSEGMHYINHPTLNDKENRDTFNDPTYQKSKRITEEPIYHYAFCKRPQDFVLKHTFYALRKGYVQDAVRKGMTIKQVALANPMNSDWWNATDVKGIIETFEGKHPPAALNHPLASYIWDKKPLPRDGGDLIDWSKLEDAYWRSFPKP